MHFGADYASPAEGTLGAGQGQTPPMRFLPYAQAEAEHSNDKQKTATVCLIPRMASGL
ncbi:hypothetical protein SDC9_150976 [bioreactor metagenome]|uniref:Uncharacterized protein n=1 Tax=bioreactor metagenome TaxID=1076179 RepID=A0A645ETB7_9ZZZZ